MALVQWCSGSWLLSISVEASDLAEYTRGINYAYPLTFTVLKHHPYVVFSDILPQASNPDVSEKREPLVSGLRLYFRVLLEASLLQD